ncbi:DUF4224 domain-containing protein [Pseudomonas shirazensis]|uniref:DUF4224 domain-containing protein n=1 Tax=Pseudomonas shirazensis TaxID=2745494 RepID=UPI003D2B669D
MPVEFLTHEQVCELTGAKTKKAQIANLAQNGIRHSIKVNGWPCVTVGAVEGYAPQVDEEPAVPAWIPDFSKIN